MMRTTLCAMMLAVCATATWAQDGAAIADAQQGVVRGTVTAKLTGAALANAVVTIEALNQQLFTNGQGRFNILRVKPGTYRLNVRQLGYQPVNIEFVVGASGATDLNVQMDRIATKLTEFKVVEKQRCLAPGRPTLADGEQIVAVFEQLEQSSVRLALFARQYPYRMSIERRMTVRDASGKELLENVTFISKEGQQEAMYRPGRVVQRVQGSGGMYSFQIPSLLDFADKRFIENHCFMLAGLDQLPSDSGTGTETVVRVDFTASSKLDDPDVEGTVFLDSASYRLRRAELRLTKLPRGVDNVASVRVETTFRDVMAGMPVINVLNGVTDMKAVNGKPPRVVSRTEKQVVARLIYTKQPPDSLRPAHY